MWIEGSLASHWLRTSVGGRLNTVGNMVEDAEIDIVAGIAKRLVEWVAGEWTTWRWMTIKEDTSLKVTHLVLLRVLDLQWQCFNQVAQMGVVG